VFGLAHRGKKRLGISENRVLVGMLEPVRRGGSDRRLERSSMHSEPDIVWVMK
jgi:hypothetical protein